MQFSYGLTMRLGIFLAEHTHPVPTLIVTVICFSASVLGASYMTTIWPFLILYGILFGLLVGICFMIPVV